MYYTTKEFAKMLGVRVRTVRYWISEKKIKAIKLSPNTEWKIPSVEFEKMAKIKGII